jgi:hypothetical protein
MPGLYDLTRGRGPMIFRENDRDRFYRLSRPLGNGCRGWVGQFDSHGWPVFWVDRRPRIAFEVAWELANGKPVPAGMTALPECDTGVCVRPDHLCLEPDNTAPADPAPCGPLTTAECAFLLEWVDCFGSTERDASRALGGMRMNTIRRGLRLARFAVSPL